MTKIEHTITSIRQCNRDTECIVVIFSEFNSPKDMAEYLEEAKKSWKESNMPGTVPKELLDHIRQHRFQHNEFPMHFSFHEWSKRKLMLNQKVEINMPLQLGDIIAVDDDEGT